MYGITYKLFIVFCIVSPSILTQNVRKYKVEEEAIKLYKQDFKSVLKRFRRTSDYLKILQDKLADLKISTREMNLQVLHYYHGKMEEHVAAMLPNRTTSQSRSFRATIDEKYNNYFRAYGNRKQLADPVPAEEPPEEEWQKINNLDNYDVFNSHLSVPERNNMKELGFYYAGQVIHSIIENLQPLTAAERITKPPEESDIMKKLSTQHPKIHQVQGSSKIPEIEPLDDETHHTETTTHHTETTTHHTEKTTHHSDQDTTTVSHHNIDEMSTKARANEGRFRALTATETPKNSTKVWKKHSKGSVKRSSTASEAPKTSTKGSKHSKGPIKSSSPYKATTKRKGQTISVTFSDQ